MATIRAAVAGELGTFGRSTVIGILGITALLLSVNLFAMVMMRRRDFGRRRALGASQALIVSLLLVQTVVLATIGATLSTFATLAWSAWRRVPLPSASFTVAIVAASVLTAAVAALIPAAAAARREPLHELRTA